MKAIRVEKAGGPETLVLVDAPKPHPGPGEVLVHVHASGVSFADILCRTASHPGMALPPLIPGCEGSGEVEELGEGTTRFKVGDRVGVYSPPGGTYAEWVAVPENYALGLPASMSFGHGAAFTHVFLTAYHALHTLGHAREGEWAVITAAAGGVGTALVQLALVRRLRVIGGVGSQEKLKVLRTFGVEYSVDYRSESLLAFVKKVTGGRGADLVLESVGGPVFKEALSGLTSLGRLVLIGSASGESAPVHPFDLLRTSSTFATLNLSVFFANRHELIDPSWNELMDLYEAGKIRPVITQRFPLERAPEAHRLMESRETVGKLLLLPRGEEP